MRVVLSPDEVRQKFDRLEQLVSVAGDGRAERLREFRSIIDELRLFTTSADAREQLGSAAGWGVTLFHERPRPPRETAVTPGEERLKEFIRDELSQARRNIHDVAGG
jgi:hypothetical protein